MTAGSRATLGIYSLPPDDEVHAFWRWFASAAPGLEREYDAASILVRLDEQVDKLGPVTWELGPGRDAVNSLTISPDGDSEALPVAQHVVALAPTMEGWEFYSSRQPRSWTLQFMIESGSGSSVEVDARQWRYVMYRLRDGRFDIVLEQRDPRFDTEDDAYRAAVVVVDGLLGEAMRLTHIAYIEPVAALTKEQSPQANDVSVLAKHLASLLG